jgi:CRP-like cAMP-binding protein
MALEKIITPLAHVGLFHGLELRQLRDIGRSAERVVLEAGRAIVTEGEVADAAYLTVRGRAAVRREHDAPGDELPPGTLIGEMAMLIETTYLATVVALEPLKALRLPRESLRAVMEADPRIAEHLAGKMAARLKALAAELKAIERGFGGAGRERLRLPDPERSQTVDGAPLNPLSRLLNMVTSDDVTLSR